MPFRKAGIAIAVLSGLAAINAAKYFLFQAGFPIPAWLVFNTCTPSIAVFIIGFFTKRREIMAASLPFLAFFGTGGLFTFGWIGYAVISQIGHVLMTLAVIYTVTVLIIEKKWKLPAIGFIIGLIIFSLILPLQWKYIGDHPDYLKRMGDPKFEESMRNK